MVTSIPLAASALLSNTVSCSGPPPLNASETIAKWHLGLSNRQGIGEPAGHWARMDLNLGQRKTIGAPSVTQSRAEIIIPKDYYQRVFIQLVCSDAKTQGRQH
jgi:hypothetical protein